MERFESILVDVDATAAVHPELDRAVRLARRCGASLTIVDSMTASAHTSDPRWGDIEEDIVTARRHQLMRLALRVPEIPTTSQLLVGESATILIHEVLRSNHDLLVRSHARDLTASNHHAVVNEELLRKCPCPVLLVGPGRTPEHPRVVGVVTAGKKDSPEAPLGARVVALTLSMAQLENGAPMLLQTWVPFAEEMIRANSLEDSFAAYLEAERRRTAESLAQLAHSFGGTMPGELQMVSRRGKAEDIVPEFTVGQGIDLVVMAAPSGSSITGFLFGDASQKLLRKLTCSLLAVKPDGFMSPVRRRSVVC